MPGMTGVELHEHLQVSGAGIPTVIITAHLAYDRSAGPWLATSWRRICHGGLTPAARFGGPTRAARGIEEMWREDLPGACCVWYPIKTQQEAVHAVRPGQRQPARDRARGSRTRHRQGAAADPVHDLLEARGTRDPRQRHRQQPPLPRVLDPQVPRHQARLEEDQPRHRRQRRRAARSLRLRPRAASPALSQRSVHLRAPAHAH